MDFDFSQEQRLLQETARNFFKQECPTKRVRDLMATPTSSDEKLWSALVEQGWTGMTLSEEVGGLGLELVDLCVVAEEMGRACLPGPFFSTYWASAILENAGTPAQRKPLLEAIASGEKKASVAWLESGADWKPESIAMTATNDGDSVRLTGRKVFVTDAASADVILVVVRQGKSWVVAPVDSSAKGVFIRDLASMDETRKLADVTFEGVTVKYSHLLGIANADDLQRANDLASVVLLRRTRRHHATPHGDEHRLCEKSPAVRQADRILPGRAAPVRGHASLHGKFPLGSVLCCVGPWYA